MEEKKNFENGNNLINFLKGLFFRVCFLLFCYFYLKIPWGRAHMNF